MQTNQAAAKSRDTLLWKISAVTTFALVGVAAAVIAFNGARAQATPDGQQLFNSVGCSGCHSSDGHGSMGGDAPALAGNGNLADANHVITQILKGGGAMPPFGTQLSDDQIAAIANYVRHSFGNNYDPLITAADVTALRN